MGLDIIERNWIKERIMDFSRERKKDISENERTRRLIAIKKVINIWCLFARSHTQAATCARSLPRFKTVHEFSKLASDVVLYAGNSAQRKQVGV